MINTVLGQVDADLFQFVSMHEHCFLDSDVYVLPAREETPTPNRVSIETLGFIRWNYEACPDNFVLDDDQLTTKELVPLGAVPGAAIVDVTPTGIGRGPDTARRLAAVSSATGVMIATGCGFYVAATHPEWLQAMTAEQIADYIVDELDSGIGRPASGQLSSAR
ncbi:phosphotriesterase family protein [Kribbella sp. VKM Ac-2527]|uniref:Phosphotriesterase family protein n=1 Tax=Kribbella caucasensis TaxID=2512215 RepID=A0A4R6KK74_9ACTN|nr:hypothetical protein [Kribbella sp. VKM Ac-2527]TDO50521.1 phosphotriesterase family protein [Kribbella sp. VKM Ac-2527]